MTETTAKGTAVAPFQQFKTEFQVAMPQLAQLLPTHVKPEKFQAVVMGVVTANPDLLTVDRRSLFKACRDAAELGLSLNPALGEADILKQYDKRAGGYVARFSPRYGGLMKLARQSGQLRTIYAHTVREKDVFEMDLGMEKNLKHKPTHGDRGELVGAYCVWVMTDGTKDFEYMDKSQVLAIRARSSAKTKDGTVVGPWVTDEEEMWRKTVVRRASKYWPRSAEVERMASALNELDSETLEGTPVEGAVDVTTWEEAVPDPAAPAEEAPPAATAQVDALAERIGAKPADPAPAAAAAAKPVRARVIKVPEKDGVYDWQKYAADMQAYLGDAPDHNKAWTANAVVLANLKTARPDLYDALDQFRNTL